MSRSSTLITLGVLIALSPFLGLPHAFLSFILPVLGVITLAIGYLIRKNHIAQMQMAAPIATPANDAPSPIA